MRERVPQLIGLTLLAAALVIGLLAVADGIRNRAVNDTIGVTGSARRPVVSDYGVYDTSTLEKDVTAVVNVTFALE